jgi:chromosome partitioning protein
MARKIAVTLRKGGSGKTTTAVNLATALQQRGKRVLLVDLDPQANATLMVGVNPLELEQNVNDVLTNYNVRPDQAVVTNDYGLCLLPSHPDLAATEASMTAAQVGALRGLLEPLEPHYDFIVVDTPPSESPLTVNALAYVDDVLVPLQAHFLAMQGLDQVLKQVEQVRGGLNPGLRIIGILPTMVNNRTNIARMVLDQVRDTYPSLVYPFQVDYSIRHVEASLAGKPIVLFDPESPGAQAYQQLAETML